MGSIPAENLLGGVSRQPDIIRNPNQLQESINLNPNVSEGLVKRALSEIQREITDSIPEDSFIHFFEDGAKNRYILIITHEGAATEAEVRVWDLSTSLESTVTIDASLLNYFLISNTLTARDQFRALTVADTTFLVNRERVVTSQGPATGNTSTPAALFVKTGKADSDYTIQVSATYFDLTGLVYGVTETTLTVDNETRNPATIAEALLTKLEALPNFTTYINVTRSDGLLFFELVDPGGAPPYANSGAITVQIKKDPVGHGEGMIAINGEVRDFTNLPRAYKHGQRVLVSGDATNKFSDYYVEFEGVNTASTALQDGKWKECAFVGDTGLVGLDPDSSDAVLPLILTVDRSTVITDAGHPMTISYDLPNGDTYGLRTSGDLESNSDPSFVGTTINDVFLHRNRLGFLAGENVILSETNEFLNFYITTVLDELDSNPIDIAADSGGVSILERAVVFDRRLFVFSKDTQFVLESSGALTANSSLVPVTYFESDPRSRPVTTARSLLFSSTQSSDSSRVFEFQSLDTDIYDAQDVTIHIPKYIQGNIQGMVANANERTLVAWTDQSDNDGKAVLYINNFLYQNNEKIQNAWHQWELNSCGRQLGKILGAHFFGDELHVFLWSPETLNPIVIKITVDDVRYDLGANFKYRLDFRADYDASSFTIGPANAYRSFVYKYGSLTNVPKLVKFSDSAPMYSEIEPVEVLEDIPSGGIEIRVPFDTTDFVLGFEAHCEWQPSKPSPRDQNGNTILRLLDHFEIMEWRVLHVDTKEYTVTTSSIGRDDSPEIFDSHDVEVPDYDAIGTNTDAYSSSIGLMHKDFNMSIDSSNIFPATWVSQEYDVDGNTIKG